MVEHDQINKDSYRSVESAATYHRLVRGTGLSRTAIKGCVATATERRTIARFLRRIPHTHVLDAPAGTGKLAPVFADLGASVVSCDISVDMLELARQEYARVGHTDCAFVVADIEHLSATVQGGFDAAVCLRLLHRVPTPVQDRVLRELSQVAAYTIVTLSCASPSPWRTRARNVAKRLIGARVSTDAPPTPAEVAERVANAGFTVRDYSRTSPLSGQVAFLARSERY